MVAAPLQVAILGFGTVGGGVVSILQKNAELIEKRVGMPIQVKKVLVRDCKKPRAVQLPEGMVTENFEEILADPEIHVVIEVMGGIETAKSYILKAIDAGKNVITANKDLLALHGKELLEAAGAKGVDLEFEASVAGAIPIIRPLKVCLAGNRIEEIKGIINGTTNYILTKMSNEGLDFTDVLKEAQEKGYAEADPTSDVEGLDAARKLSILASIAFNTRVTFHDVYAEGITKISAADIEYAKELGYTIKLLGIAKEVEGEVEVRVHPTMVKVDHPLASVNDVFNAIFVKGDAFGETMFYGRGAGDLPTGSAVVGDLMDVARNIKANNTGRIACTCFEEKTVKPIGESVNKYYIRLLVDDKPGVLAKIAGAFGDQGVSIQSMIQKGEAGAAAEIVLVTHKVKEKNMQDALTILKGLDALVEVNNLIRVEGEK